MSSRTSNSRHVVTAVIVAHDGARLLPGLVQGMREQTRPVDRAVGVDTGSGDRSGALLAELLGSDAVFGMEPSTGYGAAVARALQHPVARRVPPSSEDGVTEWIWLLHDDCQPAPDALEHLLRAAGRYENAGVLGPKLRDLADRRVLREVGLTMDRAGRRLSGIEPGEIDQGQHDGNRSVLAVSTAGMLIRRDVWDRLGGFDPLLPLFRDDVDFCWRAHAAGYDVRVVTDAVVHHRELTARHRRKARDIASHPRLLDRRSALYVLAVNLPLLPMLVVLAGCTTGSLLRAAYFLITKQTRRAAGHLGALAWLFGHPMRIWRGRRRRAAGRKRAYAVLRPQLPHGKTLSRMAESAVGMLSRGSLYEGGGEHGGAADDPDEDLPLPPPDSLIRRVVTHPSVLLFATLAVVTIVSERSLIGSLFRGAGTLSGGALVPAWGGASSLWREYLAGYHAIGVGSTASAPPYLAVVAALSTVLGGKPWLAVDVLLLGCVPVAGMAAYLATRRVTEALAARIWIALSYALLPVATGAVAAGRLGTAVAFMLLPVVCVLAGRMFTRPPRAARRAAWGAGLLVAMAAAFVPLLWLMAAGGAVCVVAANGYRCWRVPASGRGRSGWLRWAPAVNATIVAIVPPVLLMPWTFSLFTSPSRFLLEAGITRPGLAVAGLRAEPLLLLSPGGPGLPPVWVTAGLVVPAFCSLLLNRRRTLVLSGWAVALSGFVTAVVVSRMTVISAVTGGPVPAWPGIALAVAAAGLLLAAIPVAEWAVGTAWGLAVSSASLAMRARLAGRRGGFALLLGAVALSAPVLAAASWLHTGVRGPVGAAGAQVLPPFIAASSAVEGQTRTLVLRRDNGVLTYNLLRSSDPLLGEPELTEASAATQALGTAVASLAATDSGDSQDAAQALSQFAIGYVLLPSPVDPVLAGQLNGVAGLQPLTVSPAYDLWRVAGTVSRVQVLTPSGTAMAVGSGVIGASSQIGAGTAGTLVLAEPAGGWSATLNGHALSPLASPVDGWAQGFRLPAGGGRLVIGRDNLARELTLGGEALALLVVFVLALPGTRSAIAAEAASVAAVAAVLPSEAGEATDLPAAGPPAAGLPAVVAGRVATGGTGPRPQLSAQPWSEPQPWAEPQPSSEPQPWTEPQPQSWAEPQPAGVAVHAASPFQDAIPPGPDVPGIPAAAQAAAAAPTAQVAPAAPAAPAAPVAQVASAAQVAGNPMPAAASTVAFTAVSDTGPRPVGPFDTGPQAPGPQAPGPVDTGPVDTGPRPAGSPGTGPTPAMPAAAPRKRGGSHRASRHSKPARTWRGKAKAEPGQQARHHDQEQPELLGPDIGQASDDLSLAMPNLFAPGDEMQPEVPETQPPWTQPQPEPETPQTGSRPPWELGGMS